jgi:hypothetical protein
VFFVANSGLCLAQVKPAKTPNSKTVLSKQERKIKDKVQNIGYGGKITVIKVDKQKFYGKVTRIEDKGFSIREVDLKVEMTFDYADVKKIHKGDGEKHLITGKRNNPQKGWLYGLAIFGTLAVILGITLNDKDF